MNPKPDRSSRLPGLNHVGILYQSPHRRDGHRDPYGDRRSVSALSLPVAQFPNIVPPEIQVTATYPGADAQTLEQSVATPLEAQISGVDNMAYMYSTNANTGLTQITVDFDVKTDPNIDQVLTQLRVSQAQSQLPAQVTPRD